MNCIYDFWDPNDKVPTCLAGCIKCTGTNCQMYHPLPEPPRANAVSAPTIRIVKSTLDEEVSYQKIFSIIEPMVEKYDTTRPLMDELLFIDEVCEATKLSQKHALWFIRTLRKAKRILSEYSEVADNV